MKRVIIFFIVMYQRTISPDHGYLRNLRVLPVCKFFPTCSQYAIDAVAKYGTIQGLWLATLRIARCHPWSNGGTDEISHR